MSSKQIKSDDHSYYVENLLFNHDIEIHSQFIKDLSFENPQNINEHNAEYNNDNNIDVNMNIIHKSYENRHFSLILNC